MKISKFLETTTDLCIEWDTGDQKLPDVETIETLLKDLDKCIRILNQSSDIKIYHDELLISDSLIKLIKSRLESMLGIAIKNQT